MAEQNQSALEIFGLGQNTPQATESDNPAASEPAAPAKAAVEKPEALATEQPGDDDQGQEAKPKAKDQNQDKPQTEQKKPHVVPVSRLVQERKEYKGQIADKDRRIAELEQQLAGFRQPQQVQAQEVKAPPSIEDDPVNHFSHRTKSLEEKLAEQAKEIESFKQEKSRQAAEYQFAQQVNTLEQSFISQNPDYYDALAKVREIELNKLSLMPDEDIDALAEPYGVPYADRNAKQAILLQMMEKQTAQQLLSRNINPVEYIYRLAGLYGYSKPAPVPQKAAQNYDETGEFEIPPEPVAPKQKKAPSDIGNAAKVTTADDDAQPGASMMDMIQSQWYGKPRKR